MASEYLSIQVSCESEQTLQSYAEVESESRINACKEEGKRFHEGSPQSYWRQSEHRPELVKRGIPASFPKYGCPASQGRWMHDRT